MDDELNDIWSLYFHDPNDNDWTIKSYSKLMNISTISDFWNAIMPFENKLHFGMFFLMREHIFPCWDDPENIKGGCLSIKILKNDVNDFLHNLFMRLVGETLLIDKKRDLIYNINGISTSPKKHFCIVKIWVNSHDIADKTFYNIPEIYHGDIIYKPNIENMNV